MENQLKINTDTIEDQRVIIEKLNEHIKILRKELDTNYKKHQELKWTFDIISSMAQHEDSETAHHLIKSVVDWFDTSEQNIF